MNILAVIPARGGSRGIRNKNISLINGQPLLSYTIEEAFKSNLITEVVVSTDDPMITKVAHDCGVNMFFKRPKKLSTHSALAIPTIQHAVKKSEKYYKKQYEIIVMLQPTSPLKEYYDIDNSLKSLIEDKAATGIVSIVDVDNWHPMKMKRFVTGGSPYIVDYETPPIENCPRQKLPKAYIVNGCVYASKRKTLMQNNSFAGKRCLGFLMPASRSLNIDNENDLELARISINKFKNKHRVDKIKSTTNKVRILRYQNQSVNNERLKEIYDKIYSEDKSSYFTFPTEDLNKEIVKKFEFRDKKVLEVGCGIGILCNDIKNSGAESVLGIDYSKKAVATAKNRYKSKNLAFHCKKLEAIKQKFDFVIAQEVIEHTDNPENFFRQCFDRVAKKGTLIITCPAFNNPRGYIWMTLQTLLGVQMSLTDIHFLSVFDFEKWLNKDVKQTLLEWGHYTIRHSQSIGKDCITDLDKRLKNALSDQGFENYRVDEFLSWVNQSLKLEQKTKSNGAKNLFWFKKK